MINLSSGEIRVKKVLKPTKAKFFESVREGDSLEIFHKLRSTTGASNGLYASQFLIKNYTRDTKRYVSGNDLNNRLYNFELEQL